MTTLLLRLAGPLQAWGDSSRFTQRLTRREPTKSGVLGMLAAAQGRRRTDSIEDLLQVEFAVRVDQPGSVMRDFHTAIRWADDGSRGRSFPLSHRYYLQDAVFVAGVGGDDELIRGLAHAVRSPHWAPFLGRRSCAPAAPVFLDVVEQDVRRAVRDAPWQASRWYQKACVSGTNLSIRADARAGEAGVETLRDVPLSFDPRRREHGWRELVDLEPRRIAPESGGRAIEPDFMATLEV